MPTLSSLGLAKISGPAFLADFQRRATRRSIALTIRTLAGVPGSGATSSNATCIWFQTPSSSHVAARMSAISAIRKLSSAAANRSTPKQSMMRWPRSSDCPATTYTFLMITCLAYRSASPEALFDGMRGMGRLWQAAGTVKSILQPGLLEKAVASGLRSLFVGFETLNPANLAISTNTRTSTAITTPLFAACMPWA